MRYAITYLLYLDHFLNGQNIRDNPYYKSGEKWSSKLQWYWHDIKYEKLFKETAGYEHPFKPVINSVDCCFRANWFLTNMVKYGLIIKTENGYKVTDHGKGVYETQWKKYD